ncbi:MAG TPA: response regulator [Gillisia sp.]|nr:response regulator [Gillisia sp.]
MQAHFILQLKDKFSIFAYPKSNLTDSMIPIDILPVEDNIGDILLTTEALREAKDINDINIVKDRWEALEFLEKKGVYAKGKTHDLNLLNANSPKLNSHKEPKEIKFQEHLKYLPEIMSSTSSSPEGVKSAYKNYTNCNIAEPVDLNDFLKVNASIKDFWISIVQLPKNN